MKTNQFVIIIFTLLLTLTGVDSFAQRRVIHTPRKTVVHGPHRTVVYRKRPVIRPVRKLPAHAVAIRYHNRRYYYHSGLYYVSRDGAYVRVAPPIGIRLATLPAGYVRIVTGSRVFFYAGGVFYAEDVPSGGYIVAEPPVGVLVSKLPRDTAEIEIDGKIFYEYNGILYKPVNTEKKAYEVAGELEG